MPTALIRISGARYQPP